MADSRFIDAIFCDDIRHEIGNKLTLVGCYGADLLVQQVPVTLPKICVYARIFTPVDRPFEKVTLRVCLADTVIGELNVPTESVRRRPNENDDTRWFVMSAALTLSPFFVESACNVRVEAETEDGSLISPKMRIRVTDTPATAPPAPEKASRRKSRP